jgi:hypothetical protein
VQSFTPAWAPLNRETRPRPPDPGPSPVGRLTPACIIMLRLISAFTVPSGQAMVLKLMSRYSRGDADVATGQSGTICVTVAVICADDEDVEMKSCSVLNFPLTTLMLPVLGLSPPST